VTNIDYKQHVTRNGCFEYLCTKAGYFIEHKTPQKLRVKEEIPFSMMIKVVENSGAWIRWQNITISRHSCEEHLEGLGPYDKNDEAGNMD
jgi:predicted DNA-binding protein (UPF0278 family)